MTDLTCHEAREQIDRALDDDLPPAPELQRHIDICGECRRQYESIQGLELRLRDDARAWSALSPRPLSSGTLRAITTRPVIRQKAFTRLKWYWLSAACVLLACAGIVLVHSMNSGQTEVAIKLADPFEIVNKQTVEPEVSQTAPHESIESLMDEPDRALRTERENLMTDLRAAESFLLRVLPGSEKDKRG